jgi:exosome complex exonuclease RRP6
LFADFHSFHPNRIAMDDQEQRAIDGDILASVVNVTRAAGTLSRNDLKFLQSSNEQFSHNLDRQSTQLLRLTNKLFKAATQDTTIKTPHLKTQDDIEDNWRSIVDVIDDLIEKADASLDEYTGAIKRLSPSASDNNQVPPRSSPYARFAASHVMPVPVREKPQLFFTRKVNNYEKAPFKPLLRSKPHAVVSLEESIGDGSPR